MSIQLSLLAKAIGGAAAITAPITTAVVYKDSIYELFSSEHKEFIQQEVISDAEITGSWSINKNENLIKINYTSVCAINLTGNNIDDFESKLKEKLIKDTITETEKKYRRAILKKCKSSANSLSHDTSKDLSVLFEKLNEEQLNEIESKQIENRAFTINSSVDESKLTITVTVNYDDSADSSVKECKIIGSAKSGETITSTNLNNSKETIKQSVEDKINPSGKDKENNRRNFLTKCKKSFDNEIKRSLKEKSDDTNKYEFEDLDRIFQSTTNTQ